MAKGSSKDYFKFGRLASIIFAIIPVTAWIFGVVTRISEGKLIAGIIRIFFGWLFWLIDLVLVILNGRILRVLNV